MGDIADYYIEQSWAEEARISEEFQYWMTQTDAELKKQTAPCRLPIIVSIRKFVTLSKKQRAVLAKWLAETE